MASRPSGRFRMGPSIARRDCSPVRRFLNSAAFKPLSVKAALTAIMILISAASSVAAEDTKGKTEPASATPASPSSPLSVVAVNPQFAVRGSVVTVTLTNAPKDARSVEVALDGQRIPVVNPDPNGNYRFQIPATNTPGDPMFVPLGKHRVGVLVDGRWFNGSEFLDVERAEPAPKLVGISPQYLVSGSNVRSLTLTGENFNTDTPQDNRIVFDNSALSVVWDGCNPASWKPVDGRATHGSVENSSTIRLCNVNLPDRNSVEVNVNEGAYTTASGLHLTISRWGQAWAIAWSFGVVIASAALVLILAQFAHKYWIGDRRYGVWTILFLDLETDTYSLSKLQFYMWTAAAILSYTYLVVGRLFVQGLDLPDVPASLPGILAIGAGTAIGSQFVTNIRGPKGGGPEKPSLGDFVTSGGVAAPDRVQMLVWTFVGVVGFCAATFREAPWSISTLPKIGDSLMLLMGISSAGYLGGKLARKPGPVLNEISLSPSGPDGGPGSNAGAPAPAADLSQPIAAAQQVYARAKDLSGQPMTGLTATALSALQNTQNALKASLDAAKSSAPGLLDTLANNADSADAGSRILAAEFSDVATQGTDPARIEATRQAAELAQEIASAAQELATGAAQAVGSAAGQAQLSASGLPLRIIEIRGRNLSSDATFEINHVELSTRMLVRSSTGLGAPEVVATEDDSGATNMARALRLKIDPNALDPSDRRTYDSWFGAGGKDLKFAISNPDGQLSELSFSLPPGTQQAHN